MQTFLEKVATTAIESYPDNLDELTIILPSRRAIVFLESAFKKQLNKVSWLPRFLSIEDFIQDIGGYIQLDPIDLIFELYEVHQQIEGKKAESLAEFMNWGTNLLQDFNEVDRYLIQPDSIFDFISEAKSIESWNVGGEEPTELQYRYLKFWKSLKSYYLNYTKRLKEKKKVYQGLGFRMVAEHIEELDNKDYKSLYFVGFNALTTAEKRIISYFRQNYDSHTFFDSDAYYMADANQEAGLFLRNLKRNSKDYFSWISDELINDKKEIDIYGISGNIGQAKLIGNLLEKEADTKNTAIVLANENLLLPVLDSIPSHIEGFNVTMGYPLQNTSVYNWLEGYISIFRNAEKLNTDKKELVSAEYYHKDVTAFLKSSIFNQFSQKITGSISSFLDLIRLEKKVFIKAEEFYLIDESIEIKLFDTNNLVPKTIIKNSLLLIETLKRENSKGLSKIEREGLYSIYTCFNRLSDLASTHKSLSSIEALYRLFKDTVSKETIDFVGEPLGGLQIMGVLESRTLDFETVIIGSMNEGVLPAGKSYNSFIPIDVKSKFGLPIYKEKDAIFAYHFYRLLQRAKNIHLIYNTKVDPLSGGEMSRFLLQLIHEFEKKNTTSTLRTTIVSPKLIKNPTLETSIPQNENTRSKIKLLLKKGISASAINTFLNCKLDFYYKYLLGLRIEETIEEKIENSTFGTIIHDTLEDLYKPYINQILDVKSIQEMKLRAESTLLNHFKSELKIIPEKGSNKLTFEVSKVFVNNFLDFDLKRINNKLEIHLIALEQSFEEEVNILVDEEQIPITIKGKIDRVEKVDGILRIIDYKTGGTTASDLSYKNLDSLISGGKEKALQVLIYSLAFLNQYEGQDIEAGIISLRNLSLGFIGLKEENKKEIALEVLSEIYEKMLSEELIYSHNNKSDYCDFCK